jgi:Holliday junction DNA helicase RuvA
MIGRLTGKILARAPGHVLLDVSGVGYDVRIPLSTFYALSKGEGSVASLHVHTHVREDALQLYGFASRDERSVFALLIGISGVGPKMALAILSGIGVEELRESVRHQDRHRLQKIPGVGKKTAERLLLELRDKMGVESGRPEHGRPTGEGGDGESAGLRPDAISALVNLGYSRDVARRAVERAVAERGVAMTLESVLRAALASLVR